MLPIDLQILKYYLFEKPVYQYKIRPYFAGSSYQQLASNLKEHETNQELKSANLEDLTYTIFDLETTGFIPEVGHEIISIGAVQVKGFKYCNTEKFYKVIRPIRPIPSRIEELTGLDPETIRHGVDFIDAFSSFFEYCRNTVLVAHPAKFDVRFLKTMLKRWKLPEFQPMVIDSQEIAKWILPDQDCQLDPLIRFFQLDYMERHHALNDAIMTAELFEYLLKEVREREIDTLDQLNINLKKSRR